MDRFSILFPFYRDRTPQNPSKPLVKLRLLPDERLHTRLLNTIEVSTMHHVTVSSRETRVEDFFDLFIGMTLPSSTSSLAEFEIRQYHDLFLSLFDKEDIIWDGLHNAIQKICDTTAVDQLSSLPHLKTLCEDLGSSIYDIDLYKEGLSKYEKLLEALPSEVPITDSAPNLLTHPHALKLPLEVLMEIFHLCMTDFPRPDPRSPPFSLSQTCSVWRNLAIRLPELWTSMTLEIGGKCRSQPGDPVQRNLVNADAALVTVMNAWLPRAQSRLLSWRMIVHSSIPHILAQVFHTYGSSIQLLDIYTSSEPNGIFFFGRAFPNLETLSVSCLRPTGPVYYSPRLRYQAPRLKRLTLNIRNTPDSFFIHNAEWINITHLNLLQTMLLPDQAYTILRACENLEYAAMELAPNCTTTPAISMTTTVHTKLRSLFLRASSEDMELFPDFEFTVLEKWHYAATNQDSMIPETQDLFSFEKARHVTLANIFLSEHLYECLDLFSNLETLDFYINRDEAILFSFIRDLGEVSRLKKIFLPRLRNLILRRCDDNFPVREFLNMVRNRASCETDDVCRLESASLHFLYSYETAMDVKSGMDNDEIEGFTFSLHIEELVFHFYEVYHFPILDW